MLDQRGVHVDLPGLVAVETIQVGVLEIREAGCVQTAFDGAQEDILHRQHVGIRRLFEEGVGRLDRLGRRLSGKGLVDRDNGIERGLDAGLERRDQFVRQGGGGFGVVRRMLVDHLDGRIAGRLGGGGVNYGLGVLLGYGLVRGLDGFLDGVLVGSQLGAEGFECEILRSFQLLPGLHGLVGHGLEGVHGSEEVRCGSLGLDGFGQVLVRVGQLGLGFFQPSADRTKFRSNFFGKHVDRGVHGLDLGLQGGYLIVSALGVLQLLLGLECLDVSLQVVVAGSQSEQSGNGRYGHAFNCDSHVMGY